MAHYARWHGAWCVTHAPTPYDELDPPERRGDVVPRQRTFPDFNAPRCTLWQQVDTIIPFWGSDATALPVSAHPPATLEGAIGQLAPWWADAHPVVRIATGALPVSELVAAAEGCSAPPGPGTYEYCIQVARLLLTATVLSGRSAALRTTLATEATRGGLRPHGAALPRCWESSGPST